MDIKVSNSLFQRYHRLQLDCANQTVDTYTTFIHIKSVFSDEWYNFIVPTVASGDLDWTEVDTLVRSEKSEGKTLSLSIHKDLSESYQGEIMKRGYEKIGTELYMYKSANKEDLPDWIDFEKVDEKNFQTLMQMGQTCFPGWDSYKDYTRYLHELTKSEQKNKYREILAKEGEEYLANGSMIISIEESLAYLHNTVTLPKHRRKGVFTAMVKYFNNLALENGVEEILAIVEEDEASYHALLKMGYQIGDFFYLYTEE